MPWKFTKRFIRASNILAMCVLFIASPSQLWINTHWLIQEKNRSNVQNVRQSSSKSLKWIITSKQCMVYIQKIGQESTCALNADRLLQQPRLCGSTSRLTYLWTKGHTYVNFVVKPLFKGFTYKLMFWDIQGKSHFNVLNVVNNLWLQQFWKIILAKSILVWKSQWKQFDPKG